MHLEHLCDLTLRYDDGGLTIVRPFAGIEGQGFGTGGGSAEGTRLAGAIRFASYPRLRDDGVLMPDVRGVIDTVAGPVLFEVRGYVYKPAPGAVSRNAMAAIFFRSDCEVHRWLNDAIAVHEGAIDFSQMASHFPVYVVVPTQT